MPAEEIAVADDEQTPHSDDNGLSTPADESDRLGLKDENASRHISVPGSGPWRMRLISGFVFIGWAVLLTRLIQLQGAQRQLMNDRVARQSIFSEVIPARPGEILDRNGHVLAMTVTCDSLYAVPDQIEEPWDFAWKTGSILNINADELYKRLIDNADKQFVWIKRRIDDAAKYVPLERLALSPQCGFASTHHGNAVSEEDQRRKLDLVVEIADEVWSGK